MRTILFCAAVSSLLFLTTGCITLVPAADTVLRITGEDNGVHFDQTFGFRTADWQGDTVVGQGLLHDEHETHWYLAGGDHFDRDYRFLLVKRLPAADGNPDHYVLDLWIPSFFQPAGEVRRPVPHYLHFTGDVGQPERQKSDLMRFALTPTRL